MGLLVKRGTDPLRRTCRRRWKKTRRNQTYLHDLVQVCSHRGRIMAIPRIVVIPWHEEKLGMVHSAVGKFLQVMS